METMNEYMGLEVVSAAQNIAFVPLRTLQGKIAIRVLRQRSEVEVLNIGCNMLFPLRIWQGKIASCHSRQRSEVEALNRGGYLSFPLRN